jgi:hypothetical protein
VEAFKALRLQHGEPCIKKFDSFVGALRGHTKDVAVMCAC